MNINCAATIQLKRMKSEIVDSSGITSVPLLNITYPVYQNSRSSTDIHDLLFGTLECVPKVFIYRELGFVI